MSPCQEIQIAGLVERLEFSYVCENGNSIFTIKKKR